MRVEFRPRSKRTAFCILTLLQVTIKKRMHSPSKCTWNKLCKEKKKKHQFFLLSLSAQLTFETEKDVIKKCMLTHVNLKNINAITQLTIWVINQGRRSRSTRRKRRAMRKAWLIPCTEMCITWEARKARRTRAPNSMISNLSARNSERRTALTSSAHNAGVQVALRRVKPRSLEPTSFHTTSAASRAEALDRGAGFATNRFPGADILLHARTLTRKYKRADLMWARLRMVALCIIV